MDVQVGTQCLLALGDPTNIVAKGRVHDVGGDGVVIHGMALGEGNYKVIVEVSFQHFAQLPFPTNEVVTIADAVGGFVAWPSSLVVFDMEVHIKFVICCESSYYVLPSSLHILCMQ